MKINLLSPVYLTAALLLCSVGCRDAAAPATPDALPGSADVAADTGGLACPASPAVRAARLSSLPGGGVGLFAGPQAVAGQHPDDVVLDNAKVRFVVRGGPVGVAMYGTTGGHLVDAGRVLAGGDWRTAPAQTDDLREVAIAVGMRVLKPTAIDIVEDGCSGTARVRVRGSLVVFPTMQDAMGGSDPKAIVEHEYVLRAGSAAVELRTTVVAQEQETQALVADVLFWGGEVAMYLPGHGDQDLPITTQTSTVGVTPRRFLGGSTADTTAYAFAAQKKLLTIDAGAIHAFLHGTLTIDQKGVTIVRFLAAGRDLATAMAGARQAAGLDEPTRPVSGTVAGALPSVVVEALDAEAKPLTRCAVEPGGHFACDVPIATAQLRTGWLGDGGRGLGGGGQIDAATALNLPAPPLEGKGLTLSPPAPARLQVSASTGGKPLPVRVTLWPAGGAKGLRRVFSDVDGAALHLVPPGAYDLWVHHGPTYSMHHQKLDLQAGATSVVQVELAEVVPTPGWVAMDSHVHTEQSSDSTIPVELRLTQAAAEGLGYIIATDHDHLTDYRAWMGPGSLLLQAVAGKSGCEAVAVGAAGAVVQTRIGVEVSTIKNGHFNIWPAVPVAWHQLSISALFDALGAGHLSPAVAPSRVVQCNHPLFEEFSFFKAIGFDAATTPASSLRCGALELINGIDNKATPQVVSAWLGLLGRGLKMTGVGTSDCHDYGDFIGNPRTWVRLGSTAAAAAACAFSAADVDAALLGGRAVASAGPFLDVQVKGAKHTARIGELLLAHTLEGPNALTAHVQVAAPEWMPLGRLRVFAGANQLVDLDLGGVPVKNGARVHSVDLPVAASQADGVIVALHEPGAAASPGLYRPAWAVTNPVFLDWDGDGLWWGQVLASAASD